MLWELILYLVLAAVIFWAIPKLGLPEIVRVIAVVVLVAWVILRLLGQAPPF